MMIVIMILCFECFVAFFDSFHSESVIVVEQNVYDQGYISYVLKLI